MRTICCDFYGDVKCPLYNSDEQGCMLNCFVEEDQSKGMFFMFSVECKLDHLQMKDGMIIKPIEEPKA